MINLADVHYAVLETNGNLSVMLKPEKRPSTPEDLNLSPQNPGFCYDIVIDGHLKPDNLERLGFKEKDLLQVMSGHKIKRVKDVFLALCDETGQVLVQDYHGSQFTGSIGNG